MEPTPTPSVLWITGLSGVGKTTLACALETALRPMVPALIRLDGDAVRDVFGNDLGFSESARVEQISRMQRLAALLTKQPVMVIVAALFARPDLLEWNRRHLPGYREVYLSASIDFLERERDGKGLYRGARAGRVADVVGVQVPWYPPVAPDVVLDAEQGLSPDAMAARLLETLSLTGTRV